MAYNVKFLKGLSSAYTALTTKDENTFYFTSDDGNLYLGNTKLSNAADLSAAITRIAANETHIGNVATLSTTAKNNLVAAVNEIKASLDELIGGDSGSIEEMITAVTGQLANLTTTDKSNLVAAINEVKTKAAITVTSPESSDYAKVYTIAQGGTTVGTINIPKDMVVSSGAVEVNPDGQAAGTYIVLTLANATADKIYVNVGTLVDIYTVAQNAPQVQLAINSDTREISATIVAGSVGENELASDAVTTAKIKDGNVTLGKLATAVQTSLGKADTAVQTVATGSTKGSIAVDGTDVPVNGLGTAAYANTEAFDAAGLAATAETNAKAYTDTALTWGTIA